MARILFCWELGDGLGHLTAHHALIEALLERGDDVTFVVKDAIRAQLVFDGLPVAIIELEHGQTPRDVRIPNPDSFPEVLFNCGFYDVDVLRRRVVRWRDCVAQLEPDAVVADYAPTFMLANRGLRLPLVSSGNGFCLPPKTTPMPRFRYWLGDAQTSLAKSEDRVLAIINRVAEAEALSPLDHFCDLLRADCEWLRTFAELDFYGAREPARYLGIFDRVTKGVNPRWPRADGARVFAYLGAGAHSLAALRTLADSGAAVCAYAPSIAPQERAALAADSIAFSDQPLAMDRIAEEAALFVTNGNLATVGRALLAGIPQLAVTDTMERYMTARRLELLGAGLAVPRARMEHLDAKLHVLLSDRAFTRAARRFSARYRDRSGEEQCAVLLEDIDRLLAHPGVPR